VVRPLTWRRFENPGAFVGSIWRCTQTPVLPQNSTITRIIAGFHITLRYFQSTGQGFNAAASAVFGLLLIEAAQGSPNLGPVSNPTEDWLWVGQFRHRTEHVGPTPGILEFWDCVFSPDPNQIETDAQRKFTATDYRVWLIGQTSDQGNWPTAGQRLSSGYLSILFREP
jgi:hypothetical protein